MEQIRFTTYLTMLQICAPVVLVAIWSPAHDPPELLMRLIASVFILGLASFMLWLTSYL